MKRATAQVQQPEAGGDDCATSHRVPGKDLGGNVKARRMIVDNRIPLIVCLVLSGCSSVWSESSSGRREVVGSNPTIPTKFFGPVANAGLAGGF